MACTVVYETKYRYWNRDRSVLYANFWTVDRTIILALIVTIAMGATIGTTVRTAVIPCKAFP